jgi:hypothetical protein
MLKKPLFAASQQLDGPVALHAQLHDTFSTDIDDLQLQHTRQSVFVSSARRQPVLSRVAYMPQHPHPVQVAQGVELQAHLPQCVAQYWVRTSLC